MSAYGEAWGEPFRWRYAARCLRAHTEARAVAQRRRHRQNRTPRRHESLTGPAGVEGLDEYHCHIDIPGHWDRIERYVPQLGHVSRECWEGLGT